MQSYLQRFAGSKRSWLPEPDPDDIELSAKRRRNDERHRSRWTSIIDRYSKDFSNVGDEIDLRTGEIVVDNGHVARMRDEFDNGDASATSPRSMPDVLGHIVADYDGGLGEYENDVENSEDDSIPESKRESSGDDEEDLEEDELNLDWPAPSSPWQRHKSSKVGVKDQSSTTENNSVAAGEFIENESPTQTRELAHSIERKETGTFQQTPLPLPQFEVPQLGLGEKLETAMQAMTTAMGAAIQTQLMAFMNIMLATRQNSTDSPSISTPESPVLSSTVRSTPTCLPQQHKEIQSRTPLHMLQSTSATRTMNSQDRPVVSPQISSGRVREVTSRGDVIREQTPGFGSLWSVPVKRKPGRPKQQSSSKSCPRTSGIAVAPKRLEKQECVSPRLAVSEKKRYPRDERPSAEFDSQGFTSSPTLGRHEREITISTPRDNTCEPNYSHKSFNKTTSGVPRMTYEAVKTHKVKDKTSQNYHQKSMSFVVDSDEDEIGMTTGSSSARQRGDSSSSQTPKVTDQDATTIAYEQHSQEYSSLSRAGLRNRDNNINYNEKAVFSDIFGNVGLDDNNYSTTSNQLRHYGKQPKLSQASDPENEFQGNDINQDMTSGLWQMDPNALKGPLVIYDVPTSHEPSKQAANVAVSRSHPKHHAGDAVSNTARTSATVTNYEELEARYAAFTTRNKREEIKYEERPPPHPCAHCKTTAATSWLHNPDGGLRRICNACFSYWKKHGGQKRPVSLEEPRSLKGKLPCANCGQIAASDWKFEIDGKRICKPCGRYAKLHNGARRPVPHPKMYECERCHNQVIKVWMLSNRAKICIDCHNEIFADYEPD